mmetsp:Transcript_4927/g.4112  ORF Transcript_4927/g.4112 Transcript_4927/m.4112 type:complete len:153 (-) Transcript_4927:589-1047(-)
MKEFVIEYSQSKEKRDEQDVLADLRDEAEFFESINPSKISMENLIEIDDRTKDLLSNLNESISSITEIQNSLNEDNPSCLITKRITQELENHYKGTDQKNFLPANFKKVFECKSEITNPMYHDMHNLVLPNKCKIDNLMVASTVEGHLFAFF